MTPGRAWDVALPASRAGFTIDPQHLFSVVVSSIVGSFSMLSGSEGKWPEPQGREGPPPHLPEPCFILSRYLMKMVMLQVPLLGWRWGWGILRWSGRWVIRQLSVHGRPGFFSRSPTEVWASGGPPVQAVAPATLGENKDEVDPSSSCISWPYLTLQAAVPRLCS